MRELRSKLRFAQFRVVILNAVDLWQCLETFLVVIIWQGGGKGLLLHLMGGGQGYW